jgi:putative endopeptidase
MRRHILTIALLAGCAVPLAAGALSASQAPAGQPAPAIGSYGFDSAGMDRSVAPGDSFYDYANATWAKNTQIPSDKSNFGMFTALQDLSQQRVRGLLDAAKENKSSKIGAAYASFLDEAAVESKGLTPIKPWLDEVRGLDSHAGYAALAAKAARNGVGSLFFGFVAQDDKQPDHYIFQMGSAGLGLPDRDFYLLDNERMKTIRAAYVAHLAKTLTLAGEGNAQARAEALLKFETEVAKVSWTREDNGDATKTYNKMTVAELGKLAPGFDFAGYIKARGARVSDVLVAQPSAFTAIAALGAKANIGVLRDQLIIGSLDNYSDVLPKAVTDESFGFYGTVINGTPENQPRWKRAVDFTTNNLTDEVSKVYVAKYFPPESKAAMTILVDNVRKALGTRIENLAWMQPETKVKAKAKLAAFKTRIGYPDQWHDYGSMRIDRGDLFGNALRANNWGHDWNIQKLGKPIYRWEWGLDPMTVNAQANFQLVAITFPAAILQPPFFDPHADPAVNYGGIGAVIGHEISHHFDDQGAKYDASGKLSDWWTPQDVSAFKALSGKLIKQYDAYEIFPGEHVKGEFTLGENIGDLAGLNIALDAYRASLGARPAPVIDGTTGDQRFFLGWAQVWRRNYREANLRSRLLTDPHAPSVQRVAVVRNMDAWYSAFQPGAGSKLFLAPEARVRIW